MKTKTLLTQTVLSALLGALACSEPTSPRADSRLRADVARAATPSFTITDLGTLGGVSADARAINDAGQVVGASATTSGDTHAFLWTATDGMKDLGTLGGTFSRAFGINSRGHVVGVSALASGEQRPFLWTPAGGMRDLGTFGGGFGRALSINNLDQVVGSSALSDGSMHAFLWTAKQSLTDLVSVVGDNSEAEGINNRQQIVGGSNFSTQANQFCALTIPFLSGLRGGFQNLGELGTADPCGGAFAAATNENDVVVGFAENDAFLPRGFRWTAESGIVDLGTLIGPDGFSTASAVNARGQIVGRSSAIFIAPNGGGYTPPSGTTVAYMTSAPCRATWGAERLGSTAPDRLSASAKALRSTTAPCCGRHPNRLHVDRPEEDRFAVAQPTGVPPWSTPVARRETPRHYFVANPFAAVSMSAATVPAPKAVPRKMMKEPE